MQLIFKNSRKRHGIWGDFDDVHTDVASIAYERENQMCIGSLQESYCFGNLMFRSLRSFLLGTFNKYYSAGASISCHSLHRIVVDIYELLLIENIFSVTV